MWRRAALCGAPRGDFLIFPPKIFKNVLARSGEMSKPGRSAGRQAVSRIAQLLLIILADGRSSRSQNALPLN